MHPLEILVAGYDVTAKGQTAREHRRVVGIAHESPDLFDRTRWISGLTHSIGSVLRVNPTSGTE